MIEILIWSLVAVGVDYRGDVSPHIVAQFSTQQKCVAFQGNLPRSSYKADAYITRCIQAYLMVPAK